MTSAAMAPASRGFLRTPGLKFFLIGLLALLLMIPLAFVSSLQTERSMRAASVASEISGTWASEQTLTGPFLLVPYTARDSTVPRVAVVLPDDLNVQGDVAAERRQRSIYSTTLYRNRATVKATFPPVDLSRVDSQFKEAQWSEAVLALGLSDLRGLKERVTVALGDGRSPAFEPSIGSRMLNLDGIHASLAGIDLARPLAATIELTYNGSQALTFAPLGRLTSVAVKADWPHPSFVGGFLPDERRIDEAGFAATWRVSHLARSVPQWSQLGSGTVDMFRRSQLGVRFYNPVDLYQMVERALKYAVFPIGAVFLTVFAVELIARRSVHPVQYVLVGLALVMFYVLLLSLAEHIGFVRAYATAAVPTVLLISTYTFVSLGGLRRAAVLAAVLSVSYVLIYVLLRSEDYALLAGALAAFAALAALMLGTARVDWSGVTADVTEFAVNTVSDARPAPSAGTAQHTREVP